MIRLPVEHRVQDIGRNPGNLQFLQREILNCQLCAHELDRPPNPILQVSARARILVAGQAPGNLADIKCRPFADPSGDRLRAWMGASEADFYDAEKIAIVPMGFCFPGYDAKGGDKPPPKRCAEQWRTPLLTLLPNIKLTLLIGRYAQNWHLPGRRRETLTSLVQDHRHLMEQGILALPHPSWRNNRWLYRNPWFEEDVLPELRRQVRQHLGSPR